MKHLLIIAAAAGLSATPALAAQTDGQASAPVTTAAETNAELQAQYQTDLAAYDKALDAHDNHVARDQAHYDHQRRAYADAMRAWRHQVWACHHGSHAACNAPTPDPANFW